jgi:hypothetical protein
MELQSETIALGKARVFDGEIVSLTQTMERHVAHHAIAEATAFKYGDLHSEWASYTLI